MSGQNYQRRLDETIERLQREGSVPRLFLHSCCGPCSSYVLEYLSEFFSITVFYYNPNLYPPEEYSLRAEEQQRLVRRMIVRHPVSYLEGDFCPEVYYAAVRGLEAEPEGGARCEACFRLRLEETARLAGERGFDYFTTTLSVSPLKNAAVLNRIGSELAEKYGVAYLYSDFKKRGGYLRSVQLSAEYGMYRQDYCGCVYSLEERQRQKELKEERMVR